MPARASHGWSHFLPAKYECFRASLADPVNRGTVSLRDIIKGICGTAEGTTKQILHTIPKEICPRGNNKVIIYFLIS